MRVLAKCSAAVIAGCLIVTAACRDIIVPEPRSLPLDSAALAAKGGSQDRTKPSAPTNLRVTGLEPGRVSLAWNPSTDNSGQFSYRVQNSWGYVETVPASQTSFTWTRNLQSRQTYSFFVYAFDAAGNRSGNSNTVTVTLPQDVTPPAPPVLSVTGVGPTHISLAWSATDDGTSLIYQIFMNGSSVQTGSATSRTFYLLSPATTYTFTGKARDSGGNWSAESEPLVVTTPPSDPNDHQAPTTPANVWAGGWGDTEFEVTWTASTDNVDAQAYIRYDIYVNGVFSDVTVGTTRSINYGVIGTNIIEVFAIDAAGNRSAAGTTTLVLP